MLDDRNSREYCASCRAGRLREHRAEGLALAVGHAQGVVDRLGYGVGQRRHRALPGT
jgi:hypothetical protein